MIRFSVALVAVLALTGTTAISVSPASAYTGAAYAKCMAKCQTSASNRCAYWCETKH
jgi:hypothetical protein